MARLKPEDICGCGWGGPVWYDRNKLKQFLTAGGDPESKVRGFPLIHWASRYGTLDDLELLARFKANVNAVEDPPGAGTALLHVLGACWLSYSPPWEKLDWLVSHGVDVLAKDQLNHEDALHLASKFSFANVDTGEYVRRVIDWGADPKSTGRFGGGAVHTAATYANSQAIPVLVLAGASIQTPDQNGLLPIHLAAFNFMSYSEQLKIRTLRELCEMGADIDAQDDQGETALIRVAKKCPDQIELAKVIIQLGANTKLTDSDGLTAKDWAIAGSELQKPQPIKERQLVQLLGGRVHR